MKSKLRGESHSPIELVGTLLIKQMKLLPSPLKNEKKKHPQTAIPKTRPTLIPKKLSDYDKTLGRITSLDVSDRKKVAEPANLEPKTPVKTPEENMNPGLVVSAEETTSEEKGPLTVEVRSLRPKKKHFSSFENTEEKQNHSDEEERYEDKVLEEEFTIDEMEKKINAWLDFKNILTKDPSEKRDDYYQLKKNYVIRSAHNSPSKELENLDCNSPALNLSLNSGLFLKRKMKSTTVCLEKKPISVSKFSQI